MKIRHVLIIIIAVIVAYFCMHKLLSSFDCYTDHTGYNTCSEHHPNNKDGKK